MGQARYEARADRVSDKREYDRNGLRLAGKRGGCRGRTCQQHVGLQTDKLFCECAQQIDIAAAPAHVDPHIAAFGPAELGKMPREFREQRLTFQVGRGPTHEHTDPPNLTGLLRAHSERPCRRRAADKRDKLASPHSITSSVVVSHACGTVRPSVFAVLRLITVSYLVGVCTGRSAGLSPLRMRST